MKGSCSVNNCMHPILSGTVWEGRKIKNLNYSEYANNVSGRKHWMSPTKTEQPEQGFHSMLALLIIKQNTDIHVQKSGRNLWKPINLVICV